jgi:hypothetical protein
MLIQQVRFHFDSAFWHRLSFAPYPGSVSNRHLFIFNSQSKLPGKFLLLLIQSERLSTKQAQIILDLLAADSGEMQHASSIDTLVSGVRDAQQGEELPLIYTARKEELFAPLLSALSEGTMCFDNEAVILDSISGGKIPNQEYSVLEQIITAQPATEKLGYELVLMSPAERSISEGTEIDADIMLLADREKGLALINGAPVKGIRINCHESAFLEQPMRAEIVIRDGIVVSDSLLEACDFPRDALTIVNSMLKGVSVNRPVLIVNTIPLGVFVSRPAIVPMQLFLANISLSSSRRSLIEKDFTLAEKIPRPTIIPQYLLLADNIARDSLIYSAPVLADRISYDALINSFIILSEFVERDATDFGDVLKRATDFVKDAIHLAPDFLLSRRVIKDAKVMFPDFKHGRLVPKTSHVFFPTFKYADLAPESALVLPTQFLYADLVGEPGIILHDISVLSSRLQEKEAVNLLDQLITLDYAQRLSQLYEREAVILMDLLPGSRLVSDAEILQELSAAIYLGAPLEITWNALGDIIKWLTRYFYIENGDIEEDFEEGIYNLLSPMTRAEAIDWLALELVKRFVWVPTFRPNRHDYRSAIRMATIIADYVKSDSYPDASGDNGYAAWQDYLRELQNYHAKLYALKKDGKDKLWLEL